MINIFNRHRVIGLSTNLLLFVLFIFGCLDKPDNVIGKVALILIMLLSVTVSIHTVYNWSRK